MSEEQITCQTCGSFKVRVLKGRISKDRLQCSVCKYDRELETAENRAYQQKKLDVNFYRTPPRTPKRNTDSERPKGEHRANTGRTTPHHVRSEKKEYIYADDDPRVKCIMGVIENQWHISKIAKKTKISKTTVYYIIKFLLRTQQIKVNDKIPKRGKVITYFINTSSLKGEHSPVYNDKRSHNSDIPDVSYDDAEAWHSVSHKSPIHVFPENDPIPEWYYEMNNWVGKGWDIPEGTIKVTTKSITLDFTREFCEKIPQGNPDVLEEKFYEHAQSIIGRFAEAHGYTVGQPKRYRRHKEDMVTKVIADAFTGELRHAGINRDESAPEHKRALESVSKLGDAQYPAVVEGVKRIPQIPAMLNAHQQELKDWFRQCVQEMMPEMARMFAELITQQQPATKPETDPSGLYR